LRATCPPAFNNGLDPDSTEGAIDLAYALPNFHVEFQRVEPPGIPTAFWRSVGPSHNVFVVESFMDEVAAAAKQDPVAYRLALLDNAPRAKSVLALAAEKAGWGNSLPQRAGRGVAFQFVFGSYMAYVAEVEVAGDGAVRVRRVVCAVDCGTVVNPDTVRAQIESGVDVRHHGRALRRDHAQGRPRRAGQLRQLPDPAHERGAGVEVHIVQSAEPPGGLGEAGTSRSSRGRQRDLRRDRQAAAQDADRPDRVESKRASGSTLTFPSRV
jgi:isoquinoline 1-oxidoreductase beta subunit